MLCGSLFRSSEGSDLLQEYMPSCYLSSRPSNKVPSRGSGYISSPLSVQGRAKAIEIPFKFNINNNNDDDDDDDKEMKEKKRMVNKRRGTRDISTSTTLIDDNILIWEILTRLPAKSLMRFKCVSKRWLSLIQQDSHFHHLHLKHSTPNLLIITWSTRRSNESDKYCLDRFLAGGLYIESERALLEFHTVKAMNSSWFYDKCMKPVNGLLCFSLGSAVRICNINTGEATPWIESAAFMKEKEKHNGVKEVGVVPTFGFGFDPVTKEHKVICVSKITISRKRVLYQLTSKPVQVISACEILTVGENSWRRIDQVPLYDLEGDSIYANGSIYWINYSHLKEDKSDKDNPEVIVAFDVGVEKFRVIPIPKFILDQARARDGNFKPALPLLEFDGAVALLSGNCGFTVKVWILNDNGINSSNINWTEETIRLPDSWVSNQRLHVHVAEGTDTIILAYEKFVRKTRMFVRLYLYNRTTKTSKEVRISGINFLPLPKVTSLFTTFVESIIPVHTRPQQNMESED